MSATQAEDLKAVRGSQPHSRCQQHRLKIQQLYVHHSRSQHPLFALWWGGQRKQGGFAWVETNMHSVLNHQMENSWINLFSWILCWHSFRVHCLWSASGCQLDMFYISGTNSPLLGWVCTVLEGSVDPVWKTTYSPCLWFNGYLQW